MTEDTIDPHVHLRDFKQADRETVKHGLEVARDSGVCGVFDMPNTDPPIMTLKEVADRFALVDAANVPEVFYGLYMGLTANPEQIKSAVGIYRSFFPRIIGFKLYAGHSVGQLGVIGVDNQRAVYRTLAKEGFDGFLAVHPEKEEEMHSKIWTPHAPISHCFARPEIAEVESIKDQLYLSEDEGFRGKLHIAHISSPNSVLLVVNARIKGRDVSSGVCPHHLVYDWNQMLSEDGIMWKVNPPLRAPGDQNVMLQYLREGLIDCLETDHAPHTLNSKTNSPWMSGIAGLAHHPVFKEYLRQNNFSEQRILEVTYSFIRDRVVIDIPSHRKPIKDRRKDYFNFYRGLEAQLGIVDKI